MTFDGIFPPQNITIFSVDSANSHQFQKSYRMLKPKLVIDTRIVPTFRSMFGSASLTKQEFESNSVDYNHLPLNYKFKSDFSGSTLEDFGERVKNTRKLGIMLQSLS